LLSRNQRWDTLAALCGGEEGWPVGFQLGRNHR
jgi:hypothetical protein